MVLRSLCAAIAASCLLLTPSQAAVVGRAISVDGDLNATFNPDADGVVGLLIYDATLELNGFDDGDTYPDHFELNGRVVGDMFGLGRLQPDRSDANYYPFALVDETNRGLESTGAFGIINGGNGTDIAPDTAPWFGIVDTLNSVGTPSMTVNTAFQSSSWTFNISGATNLEVSIDIAAMGDFEATSVAPSVLDSVLFEYSIDGGAFTSLFAPVVNEAIEQNYTMANGTVRTLQDPMTLNGTTLSNVFQNFSLPIAATGSSLVVRFTGLVDGGDEAFAFRNILVEGNTGGGPTEPLLGDANNDGVVDVFDFDAVSQNFGNAGLPNTGLGLGDANDDQVVDVFDFDAVSQNFGDVAALSSGVVPEPTSFAAAAIALGVLVAVRKRLA